LKKLLNKCCARPKLQNDAGCFSGASVRAVKATQTRYYQSWALVVLVNWHYFTEPLHAKKA
jgi:hypothetical protein